MTPNAMVSRSYATRSSSIRTTETPSSPGTVAASSIPANPTTRPGSGFGAPDLADRETDTPSQPVEDFASIVNSNNSQLSERRPVVLIITPPRSGSSDIAHKSAKRYPKATRARRTSNDSRQPTASTLQIVIPHYDPSSPQNTANMADSPRPKSRLFQKSMDTMPNSNDQDQAMISQPAQQTPMNARKVQRSRQNFQSSPNIASPAKRSRAAFGTSSPDVSSPAKRPRLNAQTPQRTRKAEPLPATARRGRKFDSTTMINTPSPAKRPFTTQPDASVQKAAIVSNAVIFNEVLRAKIRGDIPRPPRNRPLLHQQHDQQPLPNNNPSQNNAPLVSEFAQSPSANRFFTKSGRLFLKSAQNWMSLSDSTKIVIFTEIAPLLDNQVEAVAQYLNFTDEERNHWIDLDEREQDFAAQERENKEEVSKLVAENIGKIYARTDVRDRQAEYLDMCKKAAEDKRLDDLGTVFEMTQNDIDEGKRFLMVHCPDDKIRAEVLRRLNSGVYLGFKFYYPLDTPKEVRGREVVEVDM